MSLQSIEMCTQVEENVIGHHRILSLKNQMHPITKQRRVYSFADGSSKLVATAASGNRA